MFRMEMQVPTLCPRSCVVHWKKTHTAFTSSQPARKKYLCLLRNQKRAPEGDLPRHQCPGFTLRTEVHRHPTAWSQVDVNVETLLHRDRNGIPQIYCEMVRTGGVWRFL